MKCPKCHFDNPDDTRFCGNCGASLHPSEEATVSHTETFSTPFEELATGTTFADRYQVIEELGRGGMGKVYKVFDKDIQEKIVLKLLKPEIAADKRTIERFRNELKFARKISHRNVCRMYDLSTEQGHHYITMEFVPGEDLKDFIRRVGQLPIGKAISIAKQLCEGLEEAHRLGVVHRDLKPRNIMIDREGNVRIMDFGIARSLQAKGITGSGMMIGTPEYMSPEQVEGKETDQRSDIYSLGIIMYEMVTGRVPFEGDTALTIALKHKTETPPDPREFNTQVPPDLSRFILKCMEKNKERRYQKAEEVLSELEKIEKEIPTRERFFPGERPEAAVPRKRFPPFFVGGALLLAVIIMGGYFLFERLFQPEKPEKEMAVEKRWKNSIAVLPFEDLSLQKDQEHLCIGMTEAIITKLSSIQELKVIPYHTANRYKDTDKSLKLIGEELDVETILVPNLKREGNIIRVSAQLANVKEDFVIESYTYEEELDSVFEVEDNISKSIAEALEVQLIEDRLMAIKKLEPKQKDAYEYYIKGNHFEKRYRDFDRHRDFEESVKNYKQAIEIDENYALAYYGLGMVYESHYVNTKDKEDLDLALANFAKAYDIDPNLAEANAALGWAYFYKEDFDKSYQYFKRAFEISPDDPEINFHVGGFLRSIGLYRQAIKFYLRAIELDPLYNLYRTLCSSCYMHIGEFNKAAEVAKEALELEPDDVNLRLFYARRLFMAKKYDEAEKEIAKAEKLNPDNPNIQLTRSLIYAANGEKEKALAIIEGKDPIYFGFLLSNIYSIFEMKDEAIENIKAGIERGFYEIQTYLNSYPELITNHFYDSLRGDPRFQEIVEKQKKKYEELAKKYGDL